MLRSIEHRIESLFEGVFGRAFRSHVQPVELARKLAKEMDEHRTVSVSRVYVPNEYHLYLSPKDREQFVGYEEGLLNELADYLADHARREGYALLSRPRVELYEDADLAVGEFGIAARLVQAPGPEDARQEASEPSPAPEPEPGPAAWEPAPEPLAAPAAPAPLVVPEEPAPASEDDAKGGTRVYGAPAAAEAEPVAEPVPVRAAVVLAGVSREIDRPVLSLGRSRDCDVTIDDPSVSRRHAELHREHAGYAIVDLDSTNGTQVNGEKVSRAKLQPGDRITLGQTELRFEQL